MQRLDTDMIGTCVVVRPDTLRDPLLVSPGYDRVHEPVTSARGEVLVAKA